MMADDFLRVANNSGGPDYNNYYYIGKQTKRKDATKRRDSDDKGLLSVMAVACLSWSFSFVLRAGVR